MFRAKSCHRLEHRGRRAATNSRVDSTQPRRLPQPRQLFPARTTNFHPLSKTKITRWPMRLKFCFERSCFRICRGFRRRPSPSRRNRLRQTARFPTHFPCRAIRRFPGMRQVSGRPHKSSAQTIAAEMLQPLAHFTNCAERVSRPKAMLVSAGFGMLPAEMWT